MTRSRGSRKRATAPTAPVPGCQDRPSAFRSQPKRFWEYQWSASWSEWPAEEIGLASHDVLTASSRRGASGDIAQLSESRGVILPLQILHAREPRSGLPESRDQCGRQRGAWWLETWPGRIAP